MDATHLSHFIGFFLREISGFYYTSNFLRILRILLHLKHLSYTTTPRKRSENSPFSRYLVAAERKMRGQGGVMWTEYHKISDANYIGWINLIQINTTHHAKLGLMRTRKVTLILLPLKWLPQASLGAFSFTVWKNWGWGIHESTPQPRGKNTVKRNSKRESSRKSSKNRRLLPGANLVVRPALIIRVDLNPSKKKFTRS